ncbi:MAG TPA: hypothetical protein VIW29_18795 [Polyangiaceae bacterium]
MKRAPMVVVAALALLAPSAAAAAQGDAGSSGSATQTARAVEIRVAGDAAALARVRVTARELLRRLNVQANVRSAAEPEPEPELEADEPVPLVVAYVDLRSLTSASIAIEDGRTRQELTSRRIGDATSLETGVEALLHVLYLSVESMLQVGEREPAPALGAAGRPGQDKPVAAASAHAGRPSQSRLGFDVGPVLRLSSLGNGRIVPGGGLALEPRVELGRAQAGLLLSATVHGTSDLSFARGIAELRPLQFRFGPTFDWLLSPEVAGCLGLTGGFDTFVLNAVEAPDAGQVHDGTSTTDPIVSGMLGARLRISNRLFLSALASLDLDLAPASFVARRDDTSEVVLDLPRWRAGFTLALGFTAAGSRRFPTEGFEQ